MHAKKLEELPLTEIVPNRFQPRIHFDDEKIDSLAKSIIKYGVLEPIIVRPVNGKFEIIAGERRYKASKFAGKTTIPSIIVDYDDKESIELALLENVQRQELTAIEEAIAYRRILDMGYITQEELAKKTGKSQPTIANKMRLLMLDDETQDALINHRISERHARSLLKLVGTGKELEMLNRIIKERLTVRETDNEIAILLGAKKVEEKPNIEKKDEFFAKEGEKINTDVDLNQKKPDMGPVFIASNEEKKPEKINYSEIESLFDDVEPVKKEEEGERGFMDIEKIMQEAQDINAKVEPENKPELVTTPSPYDTIMGSAPVEENTVPMPETVAFEEQNKFINVIPQPEEEVKPEETVAPEPTVTFDSIFNTSFNTPVETNNEPGKTSEEETINNTEEAINNIESILNSTVSANEPVETQENVQVASSENVIEPMPVMENPSIQVPETNIPEMPNSVVETSVTSESVNPLPVDNTVSNFSTFTETPNTPVSDAYANETIGFVPEINTITPEVNQTVSNNIENLAPVAEIPINPVINNTESVSEIPTVNNIMDSNQTFESQMSVLNENVPKIETPTFTDLVLPTDVQGPTINEIPEVPVSTNIETPMDSSGLDIPEFTSTIAENAPVTIEEASPVSMSFDDSKIPVQSSVNISGMQGIEGVPGIANNIPDPVSYQNEANLNINPNVVTDTSNNDNFEKVIELVRNCKSQIEALGYNVNVNELDLLSNYQITFNIEKQ